MKSFPYSCHVYVRAIERVYNESLIDVFLKGRTTASWVPSAVFTTVTFVTGLMALLLPETLNRPLPETIEEIESWTRSLVPRGPRPTGDGSAQVHEASTVAADSLQVVQEDVENESIEKNSEMSTAV